MRAFIRMWNNPQLLVLTAVCAALYAAANFLVRIPPPVSIRPLGQLLPMTFSLLFGPAAALGIALGDSLYGILIGHVGVGSFFGFFGNFLLGYLPYTLWSRLQPMADGSREVSLKHVRSWILFSLIAVVSAAAAAVTMAWPLHLIGFVPYNFLVPLIAIQDGLLGIGSGVLLLLVYPRIRAMNMLWWQIMDPTDLDIPGRRVGQLGAWLVVAASIIAAVLGTIWPIHAPLIGGIGTGAIILGVFLMW